MNKPMLGLVLGGVLGALDGLTALVSAPEVAPQIMGIVIGAIARKLNNLPLGILIGGAISALIALPIALGRNPDTGAVYFWEIMIPGAIVGLIVGFATQKYGTAPARA
mgnify:CR=1 FL=1